MKTRVTIILTLIIITALSCKKDNHESVNRLRLVDYKRIDTKSIRQSNDMINIFSLYSPRIQEIKAEIKYNIDIYRVTYKTKYKGKTITASGLVSVPQTDDKLPVLSFQNFTNTLYSEAPSKSPDNIVYQSMTTIASMGYVVAIADYPGFGISEYIDHPYMLKDETTPSVIDMLYAVEEIINEQKQHINNNLYLIGYSQGAWATINALQFLETQTDHFNVKCTATGGGPYNLNIMLDYIMNNDEYSEPYYIANMFNAYANNYNSSFNLNTIFRSPYNKKIPSLFDGYHTGDQINRDLSVKVKELFTKDFLEISNKDEYIKEYLTKNSIESWNTSSLIKLYHGKDDTSIPQDMMFDAAQTLSEDNTANSSVATITLDGESHNSAMLPMIIDAIIWFNNTKHNS